VGYQISPHTADIRLQAWGASREHCLAEAVTALVTGFADVTGSAQTGTVDVLIDPGTDDAALVSVLEEVIFRVETAGQVPLGVDIQPVGGAVRARFRMTDVSLVRPVGAVPKAVSLHDLRLHDDGGQWSCHVTVDV
jgi:SHS2 domain-containing protein